MIGLIQRVQHAKVSVNAKIVGKINKGILLFLGIEKNDTNAQLIKLAKKVANMRMFEDDAGKMNWSLQDIQGEILVVSQFTLVADTSKGNRPGFSNSAAPAFSEGLYNEFIDHFSSSYCACEQGRFGANMQIELINDGPVTFYLQAK